MLQSHSTVSVGQVVVVLVVVGGFSASLCIISPATVNVSSAAARKICKVNFVDGQSPAFFVREIIIHILARSHILFPRQTIITICSTQ